MMQYDLAFLLMKSAFEGVRIPQNSNFAPVVSKDEKKSHEPEVKLSLNLNLKAQNP